MSIILGGAMLAWAINDSEKRVNGTPPKADVAPPAPPTDDDTGDAEQIIQETIATPSTAKYQSSTVVASEGAYRMVNVIVDAQNNFGAMLRKSPCVTYFRDGTKIRWTKSFGVQECSKPPTSDEIAILKGLNDWPKAGATKRPTAQ